MIDLKIIPRPAFARALENNLRRVVPLYKVYGHFVGALQLHLGADAAWLAIPLPDRSGLAERFLAGDGSLVAEELTAAFARKERPSLPAGIVLSPVRIHGRLAAVAGARRRDHTFEPGSRLSLDRLCAVLEAELERREEEHLSRVLDRIKEKVVSELRPRDLAYQILDGLFQLVHYDHSAALLTYSAGKRSFRVEAEKIVWTKAKSAFIGHEIPVDAGLLDELKRSGARSLSRATESPAGPEQEILQLLDYHAGRTGPKPTDFVYAPLRLDDELLGLLKIATYKRAPFSQKELEWLERFLPAARVALRNAQVRLSLERQAMKAEMRASLVTLARAVAHDVNNAIGSLLPLAQQALEEVQAGRVDPATLGRDLEVIIEKAELCRRIFSNMLRVGTERSRSATLEVNPVVREMLPLLQAQVAPREIELRVELAEGLPAVRFARPHLERVIWNLVTNAIDALSAKGHIVIKTAPHNGRGALLAVSDDGPGIPPEHIGRVQEPFFTTKPNGTGLGLSICRALAWQHGGALDIESAPGRGTEVIVRLAPAEVRITEELG
jgi:signal transduction histidine kinase